MGTDDDDVSTSILELVPFELLGSRVSGFRGFPVSFHQKIRPTQPGENNVSLHNLAHLR